MTLAAGDEWSGEIPSFTAKNSYSVLTVTSTGEIDSTVSTATKHFRCVLPLVG